MAVALEAVAHPNFGRTISATSENQNKPYERKAVVAKVLPFRHSIIPATICATPP